MNGLSVVSAQQFYDAQHREMDDSPYLGFVTLHTVNEMKDLHMLPWLCNAGQTGCLTWTEWKPTHAVKASTLYNTSGIPGSGRALFQYLVNQYGVTDIDAFEGVLTDMYHEMGFVSTEIIPFDPQYAHDWDYDRFGTPPVHYMHKEDR